MSIGILLILVGIVVVVVGRVAPLSIPAQRVFDVVGSIVAVIGLIYLVIFLFTYAGHPLAISY